MLPSKTRKFVTNAIGISALFALAAPFASAIHPQNAGPAAFEIKFKLPPPAPLSPEEEKATFKLPPGLKVELVASEPLIDTPVALSWDDRGRLFVCEMRGYMPDTEATGEDAPTGRISMLEDTDGDGVMDKRTTFADQLVLPRSITCVNGGLLVGEPPVLWFMKDTDGDGKADVKESVESNYGSRTGQPEHMANSTTWFLDNWIYSANHPMRYRLKDGKFIPEKAMSRGQWGLSQDDFGRPFYNFNSDFLRANFIPESYYFRNPNYPASAGSGVQVMKDQSCWPSHPTPGVNRGYEPKQLRDDGTLASCTATCGAAIYRGGLLPAEFAGNAFIPEPAGNLVKRVLLEDKDGVIEARNAYEKSEFWTSTDERFRPATAYTGPDGALYVVDMYRGVIQHKGFLTHYLVANIKDRKLEQPIERGRIWRVVPEGAKPKVSPLPTESAKLVEALRDKNGWVRDTAQRVLVERKDQAAVPALAALVKAGDTLAKVHALWTLEGIGTPSPEAIAAGLADANPKVRAAAVMVADRTAGAQLAALVSDPAVEVQIALGFRLGEWPETQAALVTLAKTAGDNALVRDAILSGIRGHELEILQGLIAEKAQASDALYAALAQAVMGERRAARVKTLLEIIAAQAPNSPVQVALLGGASGKVGPKPAGKPKLLYLEQPSTELASIASSADAKSKPLVAALDARVAWKDKPGVPPPPVVKPLTAQEQQLFEVGKAVYSTLCTGCHQPTGAGMAGLAPALLDSEWVLGDPNILPRILLHGLTGPIKVNGQTWSLEMPPLGAALSDEQIAGVLTYIRREWEHTANPISLEQVAAIRKAHLDRTKAWNAEELQAISAEAKAAKK